VLSNSDLHVYLTPFRFYLVTPSPFIPLPLDKGKGEDIERKAGAPLYVGYSPLGGRWGVYLRDKPLMLRGRWVGIDIIDFASLRLFVLSSPLKERQE
jgi:hypothetical protein